MLLLSTLRRKSLFLTLFAGLAMAWTSAAQAQCPSVCAGQGLSTEFEWIRAVDFLGIFNISGDNGGYADFSGSFSPTWTAGSSFSYTVGAGYGDGPFSETWRGWIDANHDGDFDDPGELILSNFGQGVVSGVANIPADALNGPTKFRLAMSFGVPPSCGDFAEGEVEDYCVTITGGVTPSCDASSPVTGLNSTVNPGNVLLQWDPVALSVGCRIFGGPLGSFGASRRIAGSALSSTTVPISALGSGTYNWTVQCACSTVAPYDLTPVSAADTFSIPTARLASAASGESLTVLQSGHPDRLSLRIHSATAGQRVVQITDLLGRSMVQTTVVLAAGSNRVDLQTGSLASGTYLVVLEGAPVQSALFVVP